MTLEQMENDKGINIKEIDINSLTLEQLQELNRRIERRIEECCNVATPFVKSAIDLCYADTDANTVDITAKILEDFENYQGSGKLMDVIVNLMNWYHDQRPDLLKLNLIFQPDALESTEAQQIVKWTSQKAHYLRNHKLNDSYSSILIWYEKSTQRLGIFCSNDTLYLRQHNAQFIGNLIKNLLTAQPHRVSIQRNDLTPTYKANPYILKRHLSDRLNSFNVDVGYYDELLIISLKSKNNS